MKSKLTRSEFARQIERARICLLYKNSSSGYDLNKNGGFKKKKYEL